MKKTFIIFMLLLLAFCLVSCKQEEDKSEWSVFDYEIEAKYDFTYRHRGYYKLKDELNYPLQNVVSKADLDNFGFVQTYSEYQSFISKIENNGFNFDEDFFKEKSLIYIANQASDVLEYEGKRYSPYNINNCVYVNDVCYITLDYVFDFFTYYFEIGVEEKSIYVFAFKDIEKPSFEVDVQATRLPVANLAKVFTPSSLKIEGEKFMVISTIHNNSFEYIPDNIYQVSQVLNSKYQAFAIRKAFFKGGFTLEKLLELDGTILKAHYEYKDFIGYFDLVNNNITYNKDFFEENNLYVHITYGNNNIIDDSGFKYSYLELSAIDYTEEGVKINLLDKGNGSIGACINVFFIAYDKTKGTNVSVSVSK